MRNFQRFLATMVFSLAAACGSSDDVATTPYDFTAAVRTGSDSGMTLHGDLVMIAGDSNHGGGSLNVLDANGASIQQVPFQVETSGGNMALTFALTGGKRLTGMGMVGGTVDAPPVSITGSLSGPGTGDSGDWAGKQCVKKNATKCAQEGRTCAQVCQSGMSTTLFGYSCTCNAPDCFCQR